VKGGRALGGRWRDLQMTMVKVAPYYDQARTIRGFLEVLTLFSQGTRNTGGLSRRIVSGVTIFISTFLFFQLANNECQTDVAMTEISVPSSSP
jgi:hypothetical protein